MIALTANLAAVSSKAPLIYLTYGDVDSPVYGSQVISFCDFLESEFDIPVKTVAFVPMRLYFQQKKKLGRYERKVHVFPVVNRWQGKMWYSRLNARLLSSFKAGSVMTRNPVAYHVCKTFQEKELPFFYDARGCHYMELEEFSEMPEAEQVEVRKNEVLCFKKADWVFSVSKALVDFFKFHHRYNDHNHSIVPCCSKPIESDIALTKKDLFGSDDVKVFCYAGSLSVWNYPKSFEELCRAILKTEKNRIIILSHEIHEIEGHPLFTNDKVLLRSVPSTEVAEYLSISDYALLLRKKAVTNQVSSPSKFADYMMAGCRIIISPEIGDLSSFVEEHGIGLVYKGRKDNSSLQDLESIGDTERRRIIELAKRHFLRSSELNMIKYRNLQKLHNGH